jgi:hypothetical protein
MKKIIPFLLFSLINVISFGQRINKITLADKGNSTTFTILLDENVVINLNQDGSIASWGVDKYAERTNDYIQRSLEPYNGRVEYYTENDNEALRGKIKFIGRTLITYYPSYDDKIFVGKISAIGPLKINYFTKYDDASSEGKLKSIGQMNLGYYSSFDNDAYKGKIKSTGSVAFTYYASLDDKAYAGKIKTVNGNLFQYYSSLDQPYLKGVIKSGNQIQVINGIIYWIKN